ncbi:hypothetical protein EQM14_15580 [Caproiciproducens sp. NJN-50]|uniref:hypothetical protein n=1 Tax=Acutalibacteraceae TaxID=3082771 RepID=UPI000FFE19A0|nr:MULTISPECIES: hypothetical protein [Acutalibacteraceae]QAT51075.1 hypothetical protein EQM14_15580 [Caproiciproducens sp. NJN-50]
MRKKIVLSLTGVLLLASVLLIWHHFSTKPDQRILDFQNDLLFQVPGKPEIVFSKKDYGFTDGDLFDLFQLSSDEMKTALGKNNMADWSRLPMKPYLVDGLLEQLAGSTDEAARAYYRQYLSAESGYYRIQNDKKLPVAPLSFWDKAYGHISGAVIDTKENRICYFRWDN